MLANAFLPRLKARGRGGFLMVSSVEAFTGTPYSACYSASKAFVLSFGEALWGEFLDTGVDVLVLLPGPTDTPLLANRDLGSMKIKAMPPRDVAEIGLAHLGRGPYIVPGAGNRWMQRILRRLPRGWVVRKSAPVVRKMVERTIASRSV
jgi:short-subunit dehydrogenase